MPTRNEEIVRQAAELLRTALQAAVETALARDIGQTWTMVATAPVVDGRPQWTDASLLDTIKSEWTILKEPLGRSQRELRAVLHAAAAPGELSTPAAEALLGSISRVLEPLCADGVRQVQALKGELGQSVSAESLFEATEDEFGIDEEPAQPQDQEAGGDQAVDPAPTGAAETGSTNHSPEELLQETWENYAGFLSEAIDELVAVLSPVAEHCLQEAYGARWTAVIQAPVDGDRVLWNPSSLLHTVTTHWPLFRAILGGEPSTLEPLVNRTGWKELSYLELDALIDKTKALQAHVMVVAAGQTARRVSEEAPRPTDAFAATGGTASDPAEDAASGQATSGSSTTRTTPLPDDSSLEQSLSLLARQLGAHVQRASHRAHIPTTGNVRADCALLLAEVLEQWSVFQPTFQSERAALIALYEWLAAIEPIAPAAVDNLLELIERVLACISPREAEEVSQLRGGASTRRATNGSSRKAQERPTAPPPPQERAPLREEPGEDVTASTWPMGGGFGAGLGSAIGVLFAGWVAARIWPSANPWPMTVIIAAFLFVMAFAKPSSEARVSVWRILVMVALAVGVLLTVVSVLNMRGSREKVPSPTAKSGSLPASGDLSVLGYVIGQGESLQRLFIYGAWDPGQRRWLRGPGNAELPGYPVAPTMPARMPSTDWQLVSFGKSDGVPFQGAREILPGHSVGENLTAMASMELPQAAPDTGIAVSGPGPVETREWKDATIARSSYRELLQKHVPQATKPYVFGSECDVDGDGSKEVFVFQNSYNFERVRQDEPATYATLLVEYKVGGKWRQQMLVCLQDIRPLGASEPPLIAPDVIDVTRDGQPEIVCLISHAVRPGARAGFLMVFGFDGQQVTPALEGPPPRMWQF